jgi:hypothetical protein
MSCRLLAVALVLVVSLWLPLPDAAAEVASGAQTSVANGSISLSTEKHSPLFAEFDRSSTLSTQLREALIAKGFVLAQDRTAARATLIFRGELALAGGPVFYKGVKVPIGDATEKALQEAKEGGGASRAETVQAVAGLAINRAALDTAMTPFWRGLALAGMASAIGDATGVKGRFNTALTGDPRGICLSRCEDWQKVNQTVYLSIALQDDAGKQEVRVLTRTFSEVVAPQEVLDRALTDGVNAIKTIDAPVNGAK